MTVKLHVGADSNDWNLVEAVFIRASVDALCRDDASEISRDPRTKHLARKPS